MSCFCGTPSTRVSASWLPNVKRERVNRRLEFELGAAFEGACGFALVLALSQMREHGLGPFGRADLPPRRNPLDRHGRFAPQPGSAGQLAGVAVQSLRSKVQSWERGNGSKRRLELEIIRAALSTSGRTTSQCLSVPSFTDRAGPQDRPDSFCYTMNGIDRTKSRGGG